MGYYGQTLSNKADLKRVMEYAVSGGFGKEKALMPVGMRSNIYSAIFYAQPEEHQSCIQKIHDIYYYVSLMIY